MYGIRIKREPRHPPLKGHLLLREGLCVGENGGGRGWIERGRERRKKQQQWRGCVMNCGYCMIA